MSAKYPWAPLEELLRARGVTDFAARLGVEGQVVARARRNGLTEAMADRLAVKAGVLAWTLWPELRDFDIEGLLEGESVCAAVDCDRIAGFGLIYCCALCGSRTRDRRRRHLLQAVPRHCAAAGCHHVLIPKRGVDRYCGARCRNREQRRRQRQNRPELREKDRLRSARYWAECRDYLLVAQRRRRAARKEAA